MSQTNIISLKDIYNKYSHNNIIIRELSYQDFDKGFYNLLNELTDSPVMSKQSFIDQLDAITKQSILHKVLIIEDIVNNCLIATGSIFLEKKFIRSNALAAHIEDVIVNSQYRKLGYGKMIISILKDIAFKYGAYKIILDCDDQLVQFYEKSGFEKTGFNMKLYNFS